MKRCIFTALAALTAGWGLGANAASAQSGQLGSYGPPSIRRSPVSPYLNLQSGGNAAADYYGIVQPQINNSRSINTLQQEVLGLSAGGLNNGTALQQNAAIAQTGMQTGHPVTVNNYQRFFPLGYGTTSMNNAMGGNNFGLNGTGTTGGGYGGAGFGGTNYGGTGFGGTNYGGMGYGGAGFQQTQTFFGSTMGSLRR